MRSLSQASMFVTRKMEHLCVERLSYLRCEVTHRGERGCLFLPLPHAELEEVQDQQQAATLTSIFSEPEIAQALDQEAEQ